MKDDSRKNTRYRVDSTADSGIEPQNTEHKKIIAFLKTVKFRKKIIGGLDARSVWKKLEELNHLYDAAIRAERIRGEALLAEYKRVALNEINKRETTIGQLKNMIVQGSPDANPTPVGNDEEG